MNSHDPKVVTAKEGISLATSHVSVVQQAKEVTMSRIFFVAKYLDF